MAVLKRIWDFIANLTVLQIVFYTIPFQIPFFAKDVGYFSAFFGLFHFWLIYWFFCWRLTRHPLSGIIFFIR